MQLKSLIKDKWKYFNVYKNPTEKHGCCYNYRCKVLIDLFEPKKKLLMLCLFLLFFFWLEKDINSSEESTTFLTGNRPLHHPTVIGRPIQSKMARGKKRIKQTSLALRIFYSSKTKMQCFLYCAVDFFFFLLPFCMSLFFVVFVFVVVNTKSKNDRPWNYLYAFGFLHVKFLIPWEQFQDIADHDSP